ncbi:hypothetical protein NF556_03375 [Ornithinimicrobium faecis]|uniref:Uncharacterized protein n=1 Tax=Ornithinimicrobium faecis TaxID=2934158 RepID=A0ABY4YVB4_9MICO|nr:hypothetical protein [Ornithinimicrobium sp. HY1793]USQ80713.1 hypothetical protein NF556_03375 [Ornithinimicrobium sp. HY1793]
MPTRRPLMPPSIEVAVMVCCAASVASLAALAGPFVLALALWIAGAVVSWGWAGMLALPAPKGTAAILYAGSLALVLSPLVSAERPMLTWVAGALALALIAAFVHQLMRVDGRPRIVESISSIALGLGVMTCGVLLIPLSSTAEGAALVVATVVGAAASSISDILGHWKPLRPWLVPLALLVGGGAAALVAVGLGMQWSIFLLSGVVAGAVSHALRSVHSTLPTMAHPRPRLVMAICSLLVTGPVAYAVALALLPGFSLA